MNSSYGLWDVGNGTGVYRSLTSTTPTEVTITNKAVLAIKRAFPGAFIAKIHGGAYQRSGLPDLYVAVQGRSIWIEMKRPGADTTRLQQSKMIELRDQGVLVGTAESPERVIELIKEALAYH